MHDEAPGAPANGSAPSTAPVKAARIIPHQRCAYTPVAGWERSSRPLDLSRRGARQTGFLDEHPAARTLLTVSAAPSSRDPRWQASGPFLGAYSRRTSQPARHGRVQMAEREIAKPTHRAFT